MQAHRRGGASAHVGSGCADRDLSRKTNIFFAKSKSDDDLKIEVFCCTITVPMLIILGNY